jgi:hypothetical protein
MVDDMADSPDDLGSMKVLARRATVGVRLMSVTIALLLAWAFTRQPEDYPEPAVFLSTWRPIVGIAVVVLVIVAVHPLAWVGRRSWRVLRTTGIGLLVLALWMLTTVVSHRSWAGPVACPSLPALLVASLLVIWQARMLRPRSAGA